MSDLVRDESQREASLKRMSELFPVNKGLRPIYLLMASAHRYAIDYIEQAPVIVLAVTRSQAHVCQSERTFVREQFSAMCERGAQLLMRAFGLPQLLRLLDAAVLTATRVTVIRRLALMNLSRLHNLS
jgi:hypothetical protein